MQPLPKDIPILLYYFSGTGNTQVVAEHIAQTFRARGYAAQTISMDSKPVLSLTTLCTIGIGFPIAAFSTYPIVWNFIESLPQTDGVRAFAFSTMGGTSLLGVMGRLRSILHKKGFDTLGERQFQMPPNIFVKLSAGFAERRIRRSLERSEKFVAELIAGTARWRRIRVLSDIMYHIGRALFQITEWRLHQRLLKIRIDRARCTRCGDCVKKCPMRNVSMDADVRIHDHCQYCLRCVAVCPQDALFAIASPASLHYRAPGSHL